MDKVALIIIYNHHYIKNIEIIERIYKNRFSNIFHLMPFYNGNKSNVIPVYENSFFFQGYISQGLKSFYQEDFCHYIFVADDLILNPIINEKNYSEFFKLKANTCFLPGFISFHEIKDQWWARVGEAFRYNISENGVEVDNLLPKFDDALQSFKKFGLVLKPLTFSQIWRKPVTFRNYLKIFTCDKYYWFRRLFSFISNKKYNLPYPLVGSYSDIFVISSDTIKQFCLYCGVFSSTNLFVEIGLPTSLVLSAEEIITENDLDLKGEALWSKKDFMILDKYEQKLEKLLLDFPENKLYIHPIKLSKWATK